MVEQQVQGSDVRRIAIIGSGPSGLFAAQALANQDRLPVEISLYDRLPTPFGLLRYGVAPDHESIRSVAQALSKVFHTPSITFNGLVEFGQDITRAELLAAYDGVIYAAGAQQDMKLNIPGEVLPGSHSARELVAWYGGHPDARRFTLEGVEGVGIVGVGNVGVDVARILLKHPADLEWTDMPQHVIEQLHASSVRDVYLCGRGGPEDATFTTRELRELLTIDDVQVTINDDAFLRRDALELDRRRRNNLDAIRTAVARHVENPRAHLHLCFWYRSHAMLGGDAVEALQVEQTRPSNGRLVGTGRIQTFPVQLVLRSIGYRSIPLPGVPFDAERCIIPHDEGRVLDLNGVRQPGEYVTGWIKRGPIGVVGTNKPDAAETVSHLVEELSAVSPKTDRIDLRSRLLGKGVRPSSLEDWYRIDEAEQGLGDEFGRKRTKIDAWHELLELTRAEDQRVGAAM